MENRLEIAGSYRWYRLRIVEKLVKFQHLDLCGDETL